MWNCWTFSLELWCYGDNWDLHTGTDPGFHLEWGGRLKTEDLIDSGDPNSNDYVSPPPRRSWPQTGFTGRSHDFPQHTQKWLTLGRLLLFLPPPRVPLFLLFLMSWAPPADSLTGLTFQLADHMTFLNMSKSGQAYIFLDNQPNALWTPFPCQISDLQAWPPGPASWIRACCHFSRDSWDVDVHYTTGMQCMPRGPPLIPDLFISRSNGLCHQGKQTTQMQTITQPKHIFLPLSVFLFLYLHLSLSLSKGAQVCLCLSVCLSVSLSLSYSDCHFMIATTQVFIAGFLCTLKG